MNDSIVTITVFGRSYSVKCSPDEAMQLREAAAYLDHQMHKINPPNHTVINVEPLLVVAALNITQELLAYKDRNAVHADSVHDQIKSMQERIQHFLCAKDEITV